MPLFIISRQASLAPQYTSSRVSFASFGQIFRSSQGIRGISSPKPRNSVMAACVCPFTKPGITAFRRPSITRSAGNDNASPIRVIRLPSI